MRFNGGKKIHWENNNLEGRPLGEGIIIIVERERERERHGWYLR